MKIIEFLLYTIKTLRARIYAKRGAEWQSGKADNKEIDFVASGARGLSYYQVAQTVNTPEIFAREFGPLQKLHDHYRKTVLTLDDLPENHDGIEKRNIIDFLLE
ncbi:MAG: hypothetical protein LBQ83_06415 [Candidatus Margulisbacteria bacterium]|nr:hypothetical protein [Candidatus Margulisiibacteriota bacterium]